MKRRSFVGALAAIPAATALAQPGIEAVPHYFSATQLSALRKLSDLIVPAVGDTPGALDAGVPEFLDFLIGESPADRKRLYREGLNALNAAAQRKHGRPFADLTAAEADGVLTPLHEPGTYAEPHDALAAFLHAAKADILTGTVNSREWTSVVSQRSRSAAGTGIYWNPIE
jgi:hypothetical protein